MTDGSQDNVPLSRTIGIGTLGQPQRSQPSLKLLASRVLGQVRETVPPSQPLRCGTMGQAETNRARLESGSAGEWDAEDWRVYFEERAASYS